MKDSSKKQTFLERAHRSSTGNIFFGVCQGLGIAARTEPWIFRFIFLVGLFSTNGFMVILYCALALTLPDESEVELDD